MNSTQRAPRYVYNQQEMSFSRMRESSIFLIAFRLGKVGTVKYASPQYGHTSLRDKHLTS